MALLLVLGGFIDKAIEEIEGLLHDVMLGIQGYEDMNVLHTSP